MRRIQVALAAVGARLFRNNVGQLRDARGNTLRYGLANPGGADLIGWLPITITPSMVGHRVALFCAVEVKGPGGRARPAQQAFLTAVQAAGGVALLAHNEADALAKLPHA